MIDDTTLTAYALNELNAADRAAVESHLEANPTDRQTVADIQATASLLTNEFAGEMQAISLTMPMQASPVMPPRRRSRWATAAIGVAATAAIAAGVGVYVHQLEKRAAGGPIVAVNQVPRGRVQPATSAFSKPQSISVPLVGPIKAANETHPIATAAQNADRDQKIAGLIQDARQDYDAQKYTEALAAVDAIHQLDPNNTYANDVRQMIEDKANNQTYGKYTHDYDREFGRQIHDSKEPGVASNIAAGTNGAVTLPDTAASDTTAPGTTARAKSVSTGADNSRFNPVGVTQTQATDSTTFRDANGNVVANTPQGSKTLDWVSNTGNAAVPGSVVTNSRDKLAAYEDITRYPNDGTICISVGPDYRLENPIISPVVNNESYSHIIDNPFLTSLQSPLSTFAVDVDTASYANVRRFIEQGQLPPADAVRIEELVNYFPYDTPGPKAGDPSPINVNVEVADCPWQPAHRLARVALKAKVLPAHKRPPSNLVFLLDISGSMADENKLPLLKTSLKKLVNRLSATDHVSIVTYASTTQILLPSTPCGDDAVVANVDTTKLWQDVYMPQMIVKNGVVVNLATLAAAYKADVAKLQAKSSGRQQILDAIDSLNADGSTDGGDGIQLAYNTAVANFNKEGTNRVILATDGDFNVGIVDPTQLTKLIEKEATTGVYLTVLGVGMGNVKDSTMEKLADHGKGNYAYLDSVEEADKVLGRQIDATLVTVAKDVKLQIEFNPATVAAYRLIGYEDRAMPNRDFNNDKKGAGEMGAGHCVTALYELVPSNNVGHTIALKYQPAPPPATNPTSNELMTVNVRYQPPEGGDSRKLEFPVTDNPEASANASSDFRFSAAVASFGMILRNSPYRGNSTLEQVIDQASGAKGEDVGGYRSQFVELVKQTISITRK